MGAWVKLGSSQGDGSRRPATEIRFEERLIKAWFTKVQVGCREATGRFQPVGPVPLAVLRASSGLKDEQRRCAHSGAQPSRGPWEGAGLPF
jgi:hypothetical protein